MKKIFTLLVFMAALALNAQSIKVFYQGSELANQDTVFLPLDNHGEDIDAFFGYQNTTNTSITYKIRKDVIFKDEDADMMFCIGDCYTGNESAELTMQANETVTDQEILALHIIYSGPAEPAFVKYTLFRTDTQTEDATSFYIAYGTGSGVREADMVKSLRAYPNPAVRNVTIEYVAPANNSSLVIKNLAGKEVYRTSVGTAGAKHVDISSMPAGVYFYGIESDGKMLCTKKLLVK